MAIKVSNAVSKPALVFNNFFLDSLTLTQSKDEDDKKPPYYSLEVAYRMYAVDPNTRKRFYGPREGVIRLEDYLSLAVKKASEGDSDLLDAMMAIEQALSIIIEDQTELGTTEVV
jgi:hypothetical protein